MNKKYHFTDEMLKELRELYPNTLAADLAKRYNCSVSAIYNQAFKYGIKKTPEFISKTARERSMKADHGGRKYQFKKGHKPFNKGKKQTEFMSKEAIEKTKATRFKKGSSPHNYKPIGYERTTKDGYVEVKVRDGEKQKNFELKHRLIWEKHNGKIPKGYNIQFKDGNRLNCNIDNLYMISRAEQVSKENTIHRYPSELKRAIRLTNKLQKQIKEI